VKVCREIIADAIKRIEPECDFDRGNDDEVRWQGERLLRMRKLMGKEALCLLEVWPICEPEQFDEASEMLPRYVFHGTPKSPEKIKPILGAKACFSSASLFPRVRALMHDDHPDLETLPQGTPILVRLVNHSGVSRLATSRTVFERLNERKSHGWVYASRMRADMEPYRPRPDLKEYRADALAAYEYGVRVGVDDLPPSLLVMDGANETMWELYERFSECDIGCSDYAQQFNVAIQSAGKLRPQLQNKHCTHDITPTRILGDRVVYDFSYKPGEYASSRS